VLSGPAIERIEASPISKLVVTNTIPLKPEAEACKKITVLSVAEILGETIKRIYNSHSVSTLFV
jgi:ribose-phosphate pyrophosphokinase